LSTSPAEPSPAEPLIVAGTSAADPEIQTGRPAAADSAIPAGTSVDPAIWAAVEAARRWLDAENGTSAGEMTLRILKIVEEAGEAAAAWVGATGQNPRKGVTHSLPEVAAELGDVAFTALVAAASLGFDPQAVLAGVADKVSSRLAASPPDSAHRCQPR
jgi:NTP pyrophosphatase (non-canonical NTP hydrolase)